MFEFYKAALSGAITKPLCSEYKNAWRKCGDDKEKLVRLVLKQQSLPYFFAHCYQDKGLSEEYLLEEFGAFLNGKYTGIDVDDVIGDYKTQLYVGYEGGLSVSDDVLALMWSNIPSLEIPTCKATKIYCGCGSSVNIKCNGFNSLIIMLFDDSQVLVDDLDENSTILVYRYSEDCDVNVGDGCLGSIKVFNKELKL